MRRYTDLVSKNATPVTNLDNAKTQAAIFTAAKIADEAIAAKPEGPAQLRDDPRADHRTHQRRGGEGWKFCALGRSRADCHDHPDLADLRQLLGAAEHVAGSSQGAWQPNPQRSKRIVPGEKTPAAGTVTMIENTVDAGTGMVSVRATMQNADEFLWPGTLVTARMTLREEEAVVVPAAAVQVSQSGSFVFVVKDGKAMVRPVKVARTLDNGSRARIRC